FSDDKTANTPMETHKHLLKDADGEDVVNPKVSHLQAVKRISGYPKGQPKFGLWYPKDSPFDFVAYTDNDYTGESLDRKSTIGDCQFLGCRLISWQCKKQTMVANSTTEAKYVAASSCCGQKGIGVNAGDLKLMLLGINLLLLEKVNAARHNLLLLVVIDGTYRLSGTTLILVVFLDKPTESEGFEQIVDFINASSIRYALTVNPTIYTSCIQQFWATAKVKIVNGEVQLQALVDGKKVIITETSVRRDLQLEDAKGIACLPNADIFEQLALMRKPKRKDIEIPQSSGPIEPIAYEAANVENVPAHSNDPLLSGEDILKLNDLIEICTKLQQIVLDLENTKTSQAQEISSLKLRVKRLEKKGGSITHKPKRLFKIGRSAQVVSFEDEGLGDQEDTPKQWRKIDDIDKDAEVTWVDETQERYDDDLVFDTSVLDGEEVFAGQDCNTPIFTI
ncbi:hypothetical protein Tco_0527945, partial [Tanacetum coccineum]